MNVAGTFRAVAILLGTLASVPAHATDTVAPAEIPLKTDWVKRNLLAPVKAPPFSFTFGGKSSAALLHS